MQVSNDGAKIKEARNDMNEQEQLQEFCKTIGKLSNAPIPFNLSPYDLILDEKILDFVAKEVLKKEA